MPSVQDVTHGRLTWQSWPIWREGQANPRRVHIRVLTVPCTRCSGQGWFYEMSRYPTEVHMGLRPTVIRWKLHCYACAGKGHVEVGRAAVLSPTGAAAA